MKALTLTLMGIVFFTAGCNSQPKKLATPTPSNVAVPAQASATPASYIAVWGCIPPLYRPTGVNLGNTPPNGSALTEGLLGMAAMGEKECVQILVDAGVDINSFVRSLHPSFADGPALHEALNQQHWDVALFLLSRGADPNVPTIYTDSPAGGPYSALDLAESSSAPENVLKALKDKNAKHLRYTQ